MKDEGQAKKNSFVDSLLRKRESLGYVDNESRPVKRQKAWSDVESLRDQAVTKPPSCAALEAGLLATCEAMKALANKAAESHSAGGVEVGEAVVTEQGGSRSLSPTWLKRVAASYRGPSKSF